MRKIRKPLPEVRELAPKMIRELASYPCICDVIKPDRRPCTSCTAKAILQEAPPAKEPA